MAIIMRGATIDTIAKQLATSKVVELRLIDCTLSAGDTARFIDIIEQCQSIKWLTIDNAAIDAVNVLEMFKRHPTLRGCFFNGVDRKILYRAELVLAFKRAEKVGELTIPVNDIIEAVDASRRKQLLDDIDNMRWLMNGDDNDFITISVFRIECDVLWLVVYRLLMAASKTRFDKVVELLRRACETGSDKQFHRIFDLVMRKPPKELLEAVGWPNLINAYRTSLAAPLYDLPTANLIADYYAENGWPMHIPAILCGIARVNYARKHKYLQEPHFCRSANCEKWRKQVDEIATKYN